MQAIKSTAAAGDQTNPQIFYHFVYFCAEVGEGKDGNKQAATEPSVIEALGGRGGEVTSTFVSPFFISLQDCSLSADFHSKSKNMKK